MVETRSARRKLEQGEGSQGREKRQRTGVDSDEFSWADPFRYGVPGWAEGESPLPEPMHQRGLEACIAAAIKHTVEIQMAKLAKGNPGIIAPKISFLQLYHALMNMQEENRTINNMLVWVEQNGVVAEESYNARTRQIREGQPRYFLDWTTVPNSGLNPSSVYFIHNVKAAVLRLGAVIGEFTVRADYDEDGIEIYRAEVAGSERVGAANRKLGHAVAIIGWGQHKNDDEYMDEYFEFLNSKGITFGVNGRGKLLTTNVLHWVYQPTIRMANGNFFRSF